MPNTIAHIGAQLLATRVAIPRADLRWVCTGAIVPDVPWILQRGLRLLAPGVDPYELRLYAIAQATLAASLLLCGALALLSATPRRVFVILGLNSLFHLLLDATQTKWGNGVHLWAPLSWDLWNLGLYWPESTPTYLLTISGAVMIAWAFARGSIDGPLAGPRSWKHVLAAVMLLCGYVGVPLVWLGATERHDTHFVATLKAEDRTGRYVEFDRTSYRGTPSPRLLTFADERLSVVNVPIAAAGTISVRATFVDDTTISIQEIHEHTRWPRDLLNYAGLAIVALIWAAPPRSRRASSAASAGGIETLT